MQKTDDPDARARHALVIVRRPYPPAPAVTAPSRIPLSLLYGGIIVRRKGNPS